MGRAGGRDVVWAAALVTSCCTTSPQGPPHPSDRAPLSAQPSATVLATAGAEGSASATEGAQAVPPTAAPHQGPLAHFLDALRDLETDRRKDHVRIVWLGDSHAQADFWTGYLRRGLQKRFGNAGPGFLHLGFENYRHHDVEFEIQGSWRMRPKQPSSVEPWGDGAFGLGGILNAGYRGFRTAQLELTDPRLEGKPLTVDLCYKPGLANDVFRVELGGGEELVAATAHDVGKLKHLERTAEGLAKLKVVIKDGRPDFCGVVIETDASKHPGVALDNLGINGARYGTALAWNEQAWAEEVKRRGPDLFVFQYGGNEASDGVVKPAEYERQALELIARAKRIRPEASCMVIGPSDRADAESEIPPIVEALQKAAQASSCMFWNAYAIMGGKGSLRKWRDDERAAQDGVHLKPKGYEELGALLLADLMRDYRR